MKNRISNTNIKLNNGIEMPLLGFGTWQLKPGVDTEKAVLFALEAGYRLVDTAESYGNEESVGKALEKSGLPREEVFITTKFYDPKNRYLPPREACEKSLNKLGLEYIDLYLIHWPPVKMYRTQTWKEMELLLKEGKCRAIGLSNYLERHISEILSYSLTVPAVNQIEMHPFLYNKKTVRYHKSKGIQLEAYSPLTCGQKLEDARLKVIADRYRRSPAQILIRWLLQKDIVVIPRSSNKKRIFENINVFDFNLLPEDISLLDCLNENLHLSWDPNTVE